MIGQILCQNRDARQGKKGTEQQQLIRVSRLIFEQKAVVDAVKDRGMNRNGLSLFRFRTP